jgi:hypothetical protein
MATLNDAARTSQEHKPDTIADGLFESAPKVLDSQREIAHTIVDGALGSAHKILDSQREIAHSFIAALTPPAA